MELKNQVVLVTGAAGLVGSNLIPRLIQQGAKIRATIHHKMPTAPDDRVEYVTCDLLRAEDCQRAVQGARYVFHCACKSGGAASRLASPIAQVTPNIVMNLQMLQAAHGAGVQKFIWLGSTTAYPPSENRSIKEEELFADDPYPAYFFVGWEKRCMEILCRMYGEKLARPMVIVLRATNIYGPNDDFDPNTSRVVAALIKKVIERQRPIEVWGRGDEVRDHIYVDDVTDAMMIACEKLDSYQAINVGSGVGHSVKELLQVILEVDNYADSIVTFDSSKPTMIPVRLVDISRARSVLGFEPKTDLRTGISRTVEWYKNHRFKGDSKLGATVDCTG